MKKKLHHHHKREAEHHKERHHHKMAHIRIKEQEYSGHESHMSHLIGGVVKDDHQEGISRVKQRKGDMEVGQSGSMSGGWEHKRMDQALVPRKG
jgi:hypothetical protein